VTCFFFKQGDIHTAARACSPSPAGHSCPRVSSRLLVRAHRRDHGTPSAPSARTLSSDTSNLSPYAVARSLFSGSAGSRAKEHTGATYTPTETCATAATPREAITTRPRVHMAGVQASTGTRETSGTSRPTARATARSSSSPMSVCKTSSVVRCSFTRAQMTSGGAVMLAPGARATRGKGSRVA
jgi:hypothetical protein